MPRFLVDGIMARFPIVVLLALAVAGCTSLYRPRPEPQLAGNHPLAGRIWDSEARAFTTADAVVSSLADAHFVLLGEEHDNPGHHGAQAYLLERLVALGRRPAVAFEMLAPDDMPAARACQERERCRPADLAAAVRWDSSGWPSWEIYEPVLGVVLGAGLTVVAADLPPGLARAIASAGIGAAPPELLSLLALAGPPSARLESAMAEEIREAHCGYAPEHMIDNMVLAQRLRDVHMADVLAAAQSGGTAALIAGFGHVRADRGVPAYLRELAPRLVVRSVGLIGVRPGAEHPTDYVDPFGGELPFDYVWFTPATDQGDPCQRFRDQLESIGGPDGIEHAAE